MQYEIRKADMQNFKEYTIWKHANEDVWEVRPEDWHVGSDVLVLVDERRVMEFDYEGNHFRVFIPDNGIDYISKKEEFKDMGIRKVVYVRFSDDDFVNKTIIGVTDKKEQKMNPYKESNFKIQTLENGFVVRSDSERFGLNEIVYQGISYRECLNYISERVDNIQPAYYVIKDLASWRWDIRDQYGMEESEIERFESLDAAISKFNEYKAMDYLKQEVLNPDTGKPARRLTLGVSLNPKLPYEMDLLHTENDKTLLISDIVAERENGYETFMTNELFLSDLKVITENIVIDEYSYYRNQTLEELTKERLDAWNQYYPEEGYTMEDAAAWAKSFLRKRPDYLKYHKVNERVPFAEFHPAYLTEPAMSLKRKGR